MVKKRFVFVFFLSIGLAFATPGCALFGEKIADEVANVIDDYCKESQAQRAIYRDQVNAALAAEGHTISVTCAGDTPSL